MIVEVNSATGRGQGEGALARRNGTLVVTHRRERIAQIVRDQAEPMGIAQRLGEGLGGTDVVEHARVFPEWQQRTAQVEADIDGLLVPGAALRELLQGHQRLLEGGHRLAVGRARHRPGPRLPAVGHGLVPHLAPQGVVRQAIDLLGHAALGRAVPGPRQCRRAASAAAPGGDSHRPLRASGRA